MKADQIREWLKRWMDERGITQESLAEKLESTPATISRRLSGENSPNLRILDQMLDAAGVDILTLVSTYSGGVGSWQVAPLVPLRSMPSMAGSFEDLVKSAADLFKDRISLPAREGPGIAARLNKDVGQFKQDEIVGVFKADKKSLEPGTEVVVQLQNRTDAGLWQRRKDGQGQVSIDGIVYEDGEFVFVGRMKGAWRDT